MFSTLLKNHYVVAIVHGIIWAAPLLLTQYPHAGDLTVSAIVSIILGYLQKQVLAQGVQATA